MAMRVKPTLLDRVIAAVSPKRAVERMQARATYSLVTGGGYKGGRRDRRATRNYRPHGGSADTDISDALPDLRSRSRDLGRNDMIGGGAIATNTTNVIGVGLRVLPAIDRDVLQLTEEDAEAWEAAAAREFDLWSKHSDATGVQCFEEQQQLAFRSVLEFGDILALRRYRDREPTVYKSRIQLVEADRLSNPNRIANRDDLVDGIRLTRDGSHLGYYVADRHPGDVNRKATTWRYIPKATRDGMPIVYHIFERLRPDQTRGVPYLAPVIEGLKQFGDFTEAEITAAVIASYFTVFVTTPEGDPDASGLPESDDATSDDREVDLAPGAVVSLGEGERTEFASPTRPNTAFNAFAEAFLSHVAVALELPYELLVKRFTASYSASRAALEMAHATFIKRRAWFAKRFCQPAYEMVIAEAVLKGRLTAPGFFDPARPEIRQAYCQADWIGPARAYLDPLKEAKADQVDIQTRVKTRAEVIAERTGGTFPRKHAQLVKEHRLAERDGLTAAPVVQTDGSDEDTDIEDEE